jgi:hypothetical protein
MDSDAVIRLRRVVLKLARQLNAASREEGLTPTQASVLGIATVRGPLSLAELTELEGINPTMLSRVIGKLDEYGLINRLRDPEDYAEGPGRLRADHGPAERGDLRIGVRPARRSAGGAVRGVAGAGKPGRGPAGHGAARPGPAPGLAAARLTRLPVNNPERSRSLHPHRHDALTAMSENRQPASASAHSVEI